MRKYEWYVIGRGLAGWHAKGIGVSSSGGDLEDRSWPARKGQYPFPDQEAGSRDGYLSSAVEGALVYDASEADADAFAKLVISGPMCDPALPLDSVRPLLAEVRRAALQMLPGLEGAFATYAVLAQDEKFTGLDTVGVSVYEALLRKVPGVKIGHVRNGKVIWD